MGRRAGGATLGGAEAAVQSSNRTPENTSSSTPPRDQGQDGCQGQRQDHASMAGDFFAAFEPELLGAAADSFCWPNGARPGRLALVARHQSRGHCEDAPFAPNVPGCTSSLQGARQAPKACGSSASDCILIGWPSCGALLPRASCSSCGMMALFTPFGEGHDSAGKVILSLGRAL